MLLRHKFPWIYPDLIENKKTGERKRIFGRVLYLFNKTILNAFLHSIFESKDRSRSYIFIIINSLGGGTGSSMFHEIALLLRKSEFLRYSSKMIIGIGILPTPDEEIGILANAYASLKEINFLQNLDQAEEKKMNYEKPFDAYFLLDQEIKGEIIRDDLLTVITEYLNVLCFGSRSFVYGLSLDAGDLMTRYFPYRGCFSTLGVYKVLFPRNVSQECRCIEESLRKIENLPKKKFSVHIPLDYENIKKLEHIRDQLDEMNFKQIMTSLGPNKEAQYFSLTHDLVGNRENIVSPALDYDFSSTCNLVEEDLKILNKYGFLEFSLDGNFSYVGDKLGHIIIISSTSKENIDQDRLNDYRLIKAIEYEKSRLATLHMLHDRDKTDEIVFSTMFLGLRMGRPAPNFPHRLRSLDWLKASYDIEVINGRVILYHAFFYGDYLTFACIEKHDSSGGSEKRKMEEILRFWINWRILEKDSPFFTIPLSLVQIIRIIEELRRILSEILEFSFEKRKSDLFRDMTHFPQFDEEIEPFFKKLHEILRSLSQISRAFKKLIPMLEASTQDLSTEVYLDEEHLKGIRGMLSCCHSLVSFEIPQYLKKATLELNENLKADIEKSKYYFEMNQFKMGKKSESHIIALLKDLSDTFNRIQKEIEEIISTLPDIDVITQDLSNFFCSREKEALEMHSKQMKEKHSKNAEERRNILQIKTPLGIPDLSYNVSDFWKYPSFGIIEKGIITQRLKRISQTRDKQVKGKLLEEFTVTVLKMVHGFFVDEKEDINLRLHDGEIDVFVRNESTDPLLALLKTPILVEVKSWEKPVGKNAMISFIDKLRERGISTGIMIAWAGISGDDEKFALHKILEAKRENIIVILLTYEDLRAICRSLKPDKIIKDAYYRNFKY